CARPKSYYGNYPAWFAYW
nr:immunoglobulin heavy chain junction region [Mus musculus]MBK4186975.1 immunoglobulin heavy chain junction region [Mus musculus]MBK4186976.1 immunoglobulin heavy chain junction region [Mus musculus]MBK4186977.1 immunoglobulin heavy chain junction region [Mus musculus]MBK4195646.1 immunoglobulin heavy chain junction region [Mus musculus]